MKNNFMLLPNLILEQQAIAEIVESNETTNRYGLALSRADAKELVETRKEALSSNGRVEFGGGMISKLIAKFCDSPYLSQRDYVRTLDELIETFYYFKNESLDQLSDDELLSLMKEYFDDRCHGCVELLQDRELEKLSHNIRYDIENYIDMNLDNQVDLDEDEQEDDDE